MIASTDVDWQLRAACRNADDPDQLITPGSLKTARKIAAQFCARCPVQAECAVKRGGSSGIWAGKLYPVRGHGAGDPVDLLGGAP